LSPVQHARGWAHRARSVAMDGAVGDGNKYQSFPFSSTYWWAKKSSDLTVPGPGSSWVFTDEHPDSIDDSIMYVYSGYTNGAGQFTELPASYYNGACGMGFADGHVIMHKWQSPTTVRGVNYTYVNRLEVTNDPDLAWLAQHTPRKN
ncbi:MAG TPA: prepilin-type cleavage/methylation domain-containing protein, partial [Verrucomicrobiae bacterium]|nr:prepilin-type cleavage/methylation domain-containing protein [Verrucomicrobiae bacterium]